jgi:hypothetical protein
MSEEIISIFGASLPQPGDPVYQDSFAVGRNLALAGYTVMTGGYGGVMEAASKGASEAGGKVTGVTVAMFEKTGLRGGPNPYVDRVVRFESLTDRLLYLVKACHAAVAMPGGIGTMSEVMLIWSFIQTREIEALPLVLVGGFWDNVIHQIIGSGDFIRPQHRTLVSLVSSPDQVVPAINKWYE